MKPHPKPKLKSFEEYRAAQEAKMMSGPELVRLHGRTCEASRYLCVNHRICFAFVSSKAQDRGQVLSDDEEEDAHAASGDPEGDVVLHSSEGAKRNGRSCRSLVRSSLVFRVRFAFPMFQMKNLQTLPNPNLKGCGTSTSLTKFRRKGKWK